MTSKIKVDNIANQSDSNIVNKCGTTITLGASGDTIALASGASQTGFGRTGTVDWQTGSIKTATFTAVNGEGYFANTSGGAFTMNLPAGTAGDIVSVVDYTNTFQTNALTVAPNGSQKIGGVAAPNTLTTEGQSVTFVYVDDTEGWKNVQDSTSNVTGNPFLLATGGTITTSGNFKIHTFTGPGTFTVCRVSQTAADNTISYLVAAGGGSGGNGGGTTGGSGAAGAGGGAGGFREYKGPADCYTASPLNGNPGGTAVTVTAQAYPITVGAGGASSTNGDVSNPGSNSIFSTITSAGGGGGGVRQACVPGRQNGQPGGSGGGGTINVPGIGDGNTPPVSPPQGQPGGQTSDTSNNSGGGGGGAINAGSKGPDGPPIPGGIGGAGGGGTTSSITASSVAYAGGGGGGGGGDPPTGTNPGGAGGSGGGGAGGATGQGGNDGTANVGGGGGGGGSNPGKAGAAGGSGIVIIRYKFQ